MSGRATAAALATGVVSGAAATVIGPLAFVLPLALGLSVAMLLLPYFALLVFMVVLLLRPADMYPALAVLQPAKIAALAALGSFALSRLLRPGQGAWRGSKGQQLLLALGAAVLLSSVLGSNSAASLALFNDSFSKIIILFFLVVQLARTSARVAQFGVTLLCVCATLGAYALSSHIRGDSLVEGSRAAFVGLLGDPNDLALMLLMATPFGVLAALQKDIAFRPAFIVLASLCVVGIVSTQSRGGLLGLGAGLGISLWPRAKNKALFLGMIACAGLAMTAAAGLSDRKSGGGGGDGLDESAQGRLDAWAAAGRMVQRHPLLGVGFGQFADSFQSYASNSVYWRRHETHNSYLKALAETGLLGGGLFISLAVWSLKTAFTVRKRGSHPNATPSEIASREALPGVVVGVLVSSFFLSQCWGWFLYIVFAWIAAFDATDWEKR